MKAITSLVFAALAVLAPVAQATPATGPDCTVWWITNGAVVCDGPGEYADVYAAPACVEVSDRLTCDLANDPECAYAQADMFDACMTLAGAVPGVVR